MHYLAEHTSGRSNSEERQPANSATALLTSYDDPRTLLAFHVNRLGKYAKYYIKDALKGTELVTADDFGFLASLVEKGEMSKSSLITYNVHEVPSGMEVIKRLLQRGLIKERVDPEDRRMKLLSVTDRGMQQFFLLTQRMQRVASIVGGKLSEDELVHLNELLGRLDHFHERIYQDQKDYDLETISKNYLS